MVKNKSGNILGSHSVATILPWAGRIANLSLFFWSRDDGMKAIHTGGFEQAEYVASGLRFTSTLTGVDRDLKSFSCIYSDDEVV